MVAQADLTSHATFAYCMLGADYQKYNQVEPTFSGLLRHCAPGSGHAKRFAAANGDTGGGGADTSTSSKSLGAGHHKRTTAYIEKETNKAQKAREAAIARAIAGTATASPVVAPPAALTPLTAAPAM